MRQVTIPDLLEFLEYMAKVELGPASGLPYEHVTFTLPEVKAVLRDMREDSELFLRFQKEKQSSKFIEKCKTAQEGDPASPVQKL